jgi:succinate-semialdehyde dehydrogenase/glutarate-semialdehyde dehydrogenase
MSLQASLVDNGQTGLSIGGEWRASSDGGTFDVLDPATAQPIATVASGMADDARSAVEAAAAAALAWSATSPQRRSELLRRGFELMIARRDELGELIVAEMGKPLSEAKGEATFAAEVLPLVLG